MECGTTSGLPTPRDGGLTECKTLARNNGRTRPTLLRRWRFRWQLQGVFTPLPLRPFTNRTALCAGTRRYCSSSMQSHIKQIIASVLGLSSGVSAALNHDICNNRKCDDHHRQQPKRHALTPLVCMPVPGPAFPPHPAEPQVSAGRRWSAVPVLRNAVRRSAAVRR